jgi:DNA-binding response OmpR family regulator
MDAMYDDQGERNDLDVFNDRSGKALVVIGDDRLALATVLVLQEMNLAVDIAIDGDSAVSWSKRAGYDMIVVGPGGDAAIDLALRFRMSAPDAQVFLLTAPGEETTALWVLGVELIAPPLDVNTLVSRFWRAAA